MEKIFIIDASGYLYSSYFAIRNMTNQKGQSTNALFGFIRSVQKIIKDFNPNYIVAVFDGPHNGKKREEIYPEYKAHRKETPQDLPYQINWAQDFCHLMGIPLLNIPEVEADDTMGSIVDYLTKHQDIIAYLCTSDKDMCQLVNDKTFILNTRKENLIIDAKGVEEIHGVPPSKIVDLLAMTGDASDNVPGLPGIGPKTAVALIKQFGSLEGLLENTQEIESEKKRQTILDNAEKGKISKQLVTIDIHVPVPHNMEFYRLKKIQFPELKAFFTELNFNSLLKELIHKEPALTPSDILQEIKPHTPSYHLVDNQNSFEAFIKHLNEQKEICFDTETTSVTPMLAELVGIGFCWEENNAYYLPFNGNLDPKLILDTLKPLFENPSKSFYGHNVKYDYQCLLNVGIEIANISFDTILASYLLNSHNRQHSLDTLVLQYFDKSMIEITSLIGKGKQIITMRDVPINKVLPYCCDDVYYTLRLKKILEEQIKDRKLEDVLFKIEMPLIKILAKMERHGIFVDTHVLSRIGKDVQQKIKLVEKKIFDQAGEEFNLNSPKQLSEILQKKLHIPLPKKTATGFSTNADVLESLQDKYPIAAIILEYRSLEKLRSTYIENLPSQINPKTHRIHCNFNQSVTATGRLSCQDPNLQNIPVRTEEGKKIREAFRPELPNWSYLSADYSQIELRLLAHLSEDPNLIHAFLHGEDIHRHTAATVLDIPITEVTKEQRYQAKAVNFGIIYGQQAFGLSKELKIDIKEAAAFIDKYFKRYPNVKQFVENCKKIARETGKAVTITGRERSIPEINSKNMQLRQLAERLAVNMPLQGMAADLIKLAMIQIDQLITEKNLKGYMVLQIHDELIFEVPDGEIETFTPLVKKTMEGVFKLKIPLIVDISLGKNWKEC